MHSKNIIQLLMKFRSFESHNLYKRSISRVNTCLQNKKYFSTINMDMDNKNNIVWLDMEMTGLDIENDKILEIACLVTDQNLQLISPKFHTVIHQPDDVLEKMSNWCVEFHAKSGLTDEVKKSNVTIKEAESQLLNFLSSFTSPQSCPLAGNTIWMDRVFLRKYMYEVDVYLNYRIIDVSSIKELCRRWSPTTIIQMPKKILKHRAIADVQDSIEELNYYRQHFIKQ